MDRLPAGLSEQFYALVLGLVLAIAVLALAAVPVVLTSAGSKIASALGPSSGPTKDEKSIEELMRGHFSTRTNIWSLKDRRQKEFSRWGTGYTVQKVSLMRPRETGYWSRMDKIRRQNARLGFQRYAIAAVTILPNGRVYNVWSQSGAVMSGGQAHKEYVGVGEKNGRWVVLPAPIR